MPSTKVMERRKSVRVASSYPVEVCDHKGRIIGRGRTGNISESGVFALLPGGKEVPLNSTVIIEMELPRSPSQQRQSRRVRYTARVVRTEPMGSWRGLGLELLEKLS